MNQINLLKRFIADESGAVTVDWVVLTAGIVGLGLVVLTSVSSGIRSAATGLDSDIAATAAAATALN